MCFIFNPKFEDKTCSNPKLQFMKRDNLPTVRFYLCTLLFFSYSILSAQIALKAPEPASGGGGGFTQICAGRDFGSGPFNSYDMTISWAGALPNTGNAFILELSDASGDFTNAVELANITDQNTNTAKEFDVNFAIPTDTRGEAYKFRVRSTDNVSEAVSAASYGIYYMDVAYNINISENGDGTPPGNLCSMNPITLQVDNVPNPETYQYIWSRSSTVLTGETSATLNVTQSGLYEVQINYGICTVNANTFSNLVQVTIGSTGVGVGITTPSATSLCAGQTETLTIDTTDSSWIYQWYKDETPISGATATSYIVDANTANFAGDYQVEISASGICTERSIPVTMSTTGSFTVTRENPENVVVLPAQPQTLSVSTSTGSPTYQWYRNNGIVSGATNATLDITQDGTYYVDVTSSGACSSTTSSDNTIAVVPSSFEVLIDYNAAYTDCENTNTTLEVATINAIDSSGGSSDVTAQLKSSFTYQWNKDAAPIAGETNETINITDPTDNGVYTTTATLGTYNDISNELTVTLITSETVTITSTSVLYCNDTDTITISTTTDLTGENYSWEQDGSSINTTDASLSVNQPGTYRLVIDKGGCPLQSNEITIAPLDPDLISLDIDGDVIFPEGSSKTVRASGGSTYQWLDSSNAEISNTDTMTFTEEGSYLLIATIDNCQVSKEITAIYLDTFQVPNVITPNGDGSNDQWVLPNSYSNNSEVTVIIYNDKGVELLNQTAYRNNWPESTTSFPNQNMVFYYMIKNASETLKQGTITVIK